MPVNRPIYRYNEITGSGRYQTAPRELGISVQFLVGSVFQSTYTTKDVTKNQLINYVLTNPGERFFNPTFGSGIRQYLFEQVNDLSVIEENLKEGITQNVENIIVNDVTATQKENTVYISLSYKINNINDELTISLEANG